MFRQPNLGNNPRPVCCLDLHRHSAQVDGYELAGLATSVVACQFDAGVGRYKGMVRHGRVGYPGALRVEI